MMIYGYVRVSTTGQARYGNSLEAQEQALKAAGAEQIYFDKFTGTKKHRPELDKLLQVIKQGDTLIVTKLDRVARSTIQGIELIEDLLSKGVVVNVLNIGIMDESPTGKLIRNIFLSFAQFERDMIVERTREGKEIARQREGYTEGRPEKQVPKEEFQKLREKQKDGEMTVNECCEMLDISRSKWYGLCKEAS
jgi:DNA invertase Pin-like site-specific DNA recombinase